MTRRRERLEDRRRRRRWKRYQSKIISYGLTVVLVGVVLFVALGMFAPASGPGIVSGESDPDEDGDGIPDAWEKAGQTPGGTPLPNASTDRKDIYLQVYHADTVTQLSDAEITRLKNIWREMAIETDGGSDGVQIHIVRQSQISITYEFQNRGDGADYLYQTYFDDRMPKHCVYRTVALVELNSNEYSGKGESPGYFSVVDGKASATDYRVNTLTHELLHNVAGKVDGQYHTDRGWLGSHDFDTELSAVTASNLSSSGFASPQTYNGCEVPV